jgi:20S proteasome subunit beta 4
VRLLTVSLDPRVADASHFHSLPIRYHNPEAPLEEGLQTLRRCIDEVERRLVLSLGRFKVKIVDENGAREIEI